MDKMNKGIIRIIVLLVVFIVLIMSIIITGNITTEQTTSLILCFIWSLWTAWKNNDITDAAKLCGVLLDYLKSGKLSYKNVDNLIKEVQEHDKE